MELWLLTVILQLGFAATPTRSWCAENSGCASCSSTKSWLWSNCRWCWKTGTNGSAGSCHETGSVYNPCSSMESISDPAECQNEIKPYSLKYDEALAVRFLDYAAAAYSDYPEECLSHAQPSVSVYDKFTKAVVVENGNPIPCFVYTAVDDAEKAVILAYRGSVSGWQVTAQIAEALVVAKVPFEATGGNVQSHFLKTFIFLYSVFDSLKELHEMYPSYKLYITGHSLGGAVASLAAAHVVKENQWKSSDVIFISFGQPRTGDYEFATGFDKLVPHSWRIVHDNDIVPHLPWCSWSWSWLVPFSRCSDTAMFGTAAYHHGTEVWYEGDDMTPGQREPRVCLRPPRNEDASCSNGYTLFYGASKHYWYFGKMISFYGIEGCRGANTTSMAHHKEDT